MSSQPAAADCLLSNVRAMVVEDDEDILFLATRFLESAGCQVQGFLDPLEAEAVLQTQRFDLLFTDLRMPSPLTGLDLAQIAKKRHPDLNVLIATGMDREFFEELWDHEFEVLKKPYNQQQLVKAVQKVLNLNPAPIEA